MQPSMFKSKAQTTVTPQVPTQPGMKLKTGLKGGGCSKLAKGSTSQFPGHLA